MSNIINLQNGIYKYELPREPSDEKDIINHDKKRRDQKWEVQPLLDFKRCTTSQKVEFINRERDRWLNGVWILVNGELFYMTGMHYDHLQYQTFEFGKARFYYHQTSDFYFRDLTRKVDSCLGRVWQKPRRYGMTAEEITEALYTSMECENAGVGLMSNENTKCKNTLLKPIIDSILKRPRFMRPRFFAPNGKKPRASLEYTNPKVNEASDYDPMNDFLGGHVYAYGTTPAAMDGEKKKYIVMDEVWKWIVASPLETLNINKKCLRSSDWLGKISMLSTMGDSDDYQNAVNEGIQIINESNPNVLDDNGQTTSGLWEYFVSALYSHDLPNFYDDYGKLDAGRAEEYIYNTRKKYVKGTKDYVFECRRMPLMKSEGLMSGNNVTVFDKQRTSEQLTALNALPPSQKPYVKGSLTSDSSGKVEFEPNREGKWKVSILPYYSQLRGIDTRNRFKKYGSEYLPPENPEYALGYDPVRYAETTSKNISKASILVTKKFDYFGSGVANRFAAMYKDRPEDPEEPHDEFFKAMRFFGGPGMYERQVESVLRKAKEAGMINFLLKAKDGLHGMWTDGRKNVVKNGIDLIQGRLRKPQKPGDIDQMQYIPFEEMLYDADGFDPNNTRPFDTMMSWIMNEHGLLQLVETNVTDQSATGKVIGSSLYASRSGQTTFG